MASSMLLFALYGVSWIIRKTLLCIAFYSVLLVFSQYYFNPQKQESNANTFQYGYIYE